MSPEAENLPVLIPPEPGIPPGHLAGEPAGAARVLGPHAAGRAVWGVSHARFALREAVRLAGLGPADQVLMPAWCCNTVSGPIRAAGAVPVLCRVDARGRLDFDDVAEKARSPRARLLVVVHYLGFPADLDAARRVCRENGLVLFEDCSHALYSAPGGVPVGLAAPLACFSIRKTLPAGTGAALTVDPARYTPPPPADPEPAPGTPRGEFLGRVEALYVDFGRAARLGESELGQAERDRLWARAPELYGPDTPAHGIPRRARVVMGHARPEEIRSRRRANFLYLLERLGDWALFGELPEGVCPLGFPVVAADREAVRAGLDAAGIGYLIHWSRKLVPSGGLELSREAAFLADHVLTLPCHQDLSGRHLAFLVERFRALGVPPAAPAG